MSSRPFSSVPDVRLRCVNDRDVRSDGDFVLYWMTAFRRLNHNFALQRAVDWSRHLNRPLLILEALRCDYRWASDRLHLFIMEGMYSNAQAARRLGVCYYPYVEPSLGHGSGLMAALAGRSCVVVSDDFPCFFLPRMVNAVARRCSVRLEVVDSNGLLPMRAAETIFPTAHAFRRFLQKSLPSHLMHFPDPDPLSDSSLPKLDSIPEETARRWVPTPVELLRSPDSLIKKLPIDHQVGPGIVGGGHPAACEQLAEFLKKRLSSYADGRNHPDDDASSGLSPWLHFGHISVHQIFRQLSEKENWRSDYLGDARETRGGRSGWWGMSESAESFLDELVTWRELGFNMCWQSENYDQYESLPDWARKTLEQHAGDTRPKIYSLSELTHGRTHDRLWNAAQNQLVSEGRMHNYLRMLWGKKIFEWSPDPQQALHAMIELNNRFALDGRNPNSYSGIFWVLGRYDRAWGPERPIYGKIRYMTSENTARKLHLNHYLEQYSPKSSQGKLF